MISQDIDLRGNHFSQIIKNGLGQIVALEPLIADKMQVKKYCLVLVVNILIIYTL